MMIGVVVLFGNLKLEALARIINLSPRTLRVVSMVEQAPAKRRGCEAIPEPSFCSLAFRVVSEGTAIPLVLSSWQICNRLGSFSSKTMLTHTPIFFGSSLEEEAIV